MKSWRLRCFDHISARALSCAGQHLARGGRVSKSRCRSSPPAWLCVKGTPSWRQMAPVTVSVKGDMVRVHTEETPIIMMDFFWPPARFDDEDWASRAAKLTGLRLIKAAGSPGVTHFSTRTFRWTDEVDELVNSRWKTQGQLCLGSGSRLQLPLSCRVFGRRWDRDGSTKLQNWLPS